MKDENHKTLKLHLFQQTFHLKAKLAKPQFGFKTSKTKDKDIRANLVKVRARKQARPWGFWLRAHGNPLFLCGWGF